MSARGSDIGICRSCSSELLEPVLDLGETPLANRLLDPGERGAEEPRHPLELLFCPRCTLVQLRRTVDPAELFGHYLYHSSVSPALLAHSEAHARELVRRRGLGPDSLVVEAASNDGYLLQYVRGAGVPVLGVEPAANLARLAEARGVPTRCRFFDRACAAELRGEGLRADVFLGNNVLAHAADLHGFVAGIREVLKPDGLAELEVPYVGDLVERLEFDTIYHEHLCYFSLTAVQVLFRRHGLRLADVERLPSRGGSLRVAAVLARAEADPAGLSRVVALLAEERARGMDSAAFYAGLAPRVAALRGELRELLEGLRRGGARIAAYGASAKGSTLLNCFGIGADLLEWVVDRSPHKQGRLTPGTQLEIRTPATLLEEAIDYALLLTWNFAEEILAEQSAWRNAGGRFIVPLPAVAIL